MESVEATALLGGVADRFEWRAEELGRPIAVEAPAGRRVDVDSLRVEQALGNLIDNALRHGAGRVQLSAASRDGAVELHVWDEGPGFPRGFADRAFERFARREEGRSTAGSGLGLSIVKTIAEVHGGSAHIGSAERTDVWIVLPRATTISDHGRALDG